MILQNKSKHNYTLFNASTHFCECATLLVHSGHPKSHARTKINLCKIIFPKHKATIIILIAVVIQYANSYLNLKNQAFGVGTFIQTKTSDPKNTKP